MTPLPNPFIYLAYLACGAALALIAWRIIGRRK